MGTPPVNPNPIFNGVDPIQAINDAQKVSSAGNKVKENDTFGQLADMATQGFEAAKSKAGQALTTVSNFAMDVAFKRTMSSTQEIVNKLNSPEMQEIYVALYKGVNDATGKYIAKKQALLSELGEAGVDELFLGSTQFKLFDVMKSEIETFNNGQSSRANTIISFVAKRLGESLPDKVTEDYLNGLINKLRQKGLENFKTISDVHGKLVRASKLNGTDMNFAATMKGFYDSSKVESLAKLYPNTNDDRPLVPSSVVNFRGLLGNDLPKVVNTALQSESSNIKSKLDEFVDGTLVKNPKWQFLKYELESRARVLTQELKIEKILEKNKDALFGGQGKIDQSADTAKLEELRLVVLKLKLLEKAADVRGVTLTKSGEKDNKDNPFSASKELVGKFNNVSNVMKQLTEVEDELTNAGKEAVNKLDQSQRTTLSGVFGDIYGNLNVPIDPLLSFFPSALLRTQDLVVGSVLTNAITTATSQVSPQQDDSNKDGQQRTLTVATVAATVRNSFGSQVQNAKDAYQAQAENAKGITQAALETLRTAGQSLGKTG